MIHGGGELEARDGMNKSFARTCSETVAQIAIVTKVKVNAVYNGEAMTLKFSLESDRIG